ncbi:putative bifunctional diguanylate cyclase/phosphodiesterase [Actinotalea fermentans]|uniref:GGDEF domain-containing protein n=1 Tax=Actinotalea fermentans TaxID=43671 RepID=A0A511YVR1_9CELL|nr:EAL domain-containing protein [Actinotalea fermentans]KGM15258.1 diguanylate cyclase [Actinotalea fermentans ATCC 43279 = JCM 9966 = DSM 3133]GEN79294.1 GGDEF domain-containing protein [Actinotalea fermentans]
MGPGELTPLTVALAVLVLALTAAVVMLVLARRRDAAARAEASATVERRLAVVLSAGRDGVVVHAASGAVLVANEAAAATFDVPVAQLVGRRVGELPVRWVTEQGQEVTPASVFGRRQGADAPPFVVGALPHTGGPVRWVQASTRLVGAGDGDLLTVLADVTGPREVRAALAQSELQFRLAMENAPIGMGLADPQWRLQEVNAALAALFAVEPAVLIGHDLSALSHPDDRGVERAQVQRLLAGEGERFSLEKRYLRPDGQVVWVVLDVVLVRAADGAPAQFVVQMRDITESRLQSEALAHRAMHDPLTGLANRSLMQDVLQRACEPPDAPGRIAVLAIDLDEFKQINDRYGHAAGDDVLIHVAGVLRGATAGRGLVARQGGDEFAIIVTGDDAARIAFEIAGSIHKGLVNPVRTHRRQLPIRASVGVAVAEPAILTAGAMGMLAAADAALYRAKGGGRSRTEVYDRSMTVTAGAKHGAAAELVHAIETGELVLHYQPTVALATGQVVGYEALVRWQHPERGLLLPGSFLPTAVEGGLAVALGTNVVWQAASYLARTADTGRWVSVNVSADQLGNGELAAQVLMALSRHRVGPGRLVIELTEAGLVDGESRIRHELAELREAGVPVLLDDFGTGIAPLSYLRDLPVDGVKLDMSFTAGIPEDPAAQRVSRALGALARELEMITIAEGVETTEQAQFLHACGWEYGQGWLFGAGESERVQAEGRTHG